MNYFNYLFYIKTPNTINFFSGYYCPPACGLPMPCPKGRFGNRTMMTDESECSLCEEGYYCPHNGSSSSYDKCHAGFYCSLGSTQAEPIKERFGDECPIGHFCEEGSSAPTACDEGLTYLYFRGVEGLPKSMKTIRTGDKAQAGVSKQTYCKIRESLNVAHVSSPKH